MPKKKINSQIGIGPPSPNIVGKYALLHERFHLPMLLLTKLIMKCELITKIVFIFRIVGPSNLHLSKYLFYTFIISKFYCF